MRGGLGAAEGSPLSPPILGLAAQLLRLQLLGQLLGHELREGLELAGEEAVEGGGSRVLGRGLAPHQGGLEAAGAEQQQQRGQKRLHLGGARRLRDGSVVAPPAPPVPFVLPLFPCPVTAPVSPSHPMEPWSPSSPTAPPSHSQPRPSHTALLAPSCPFPPHPIAALSPSCPIPAPQPHPAPHRLLLTWAGL